MRFEQYLTEGYMEKFEANWEKVEKDCAPYLSDIRKISKRQQYPYYLIRGSFTDVPKPWGEIASVRKNRRPKDTNSLVHRITDDYFLAKHGFRMRSQGLFTKSVEGSVSQYGHVHIVFPIGKYKIYWGKDVNDLLTYIGNDRIKDAIYSRLEHTTDDEDWWDTVYNRMADSLMDNTFEIDFPEYVGELKKAVVDILDGLKFKKGDLNRALTTISEIVVDCDKYWMFPEDHHVTNKIWSRDS